ncbi:hypothetical protein NFHSH190041_21540 [Shewanella sp. NFH-SH190041]|uniref:DUF3135 domain-containing protein n=1 Tax=Shewanella sp. NFH-SH190041 TaxID=2950245 RepID=UPI0021C41EFD|nr:DUF3135 domain-containing protein [Shewanella sp. NFH-SH190041]BDM64702.1 hypothetical protein NFHSH190041_21540 [Shewanella sp. NFH-SH190041]
MTQLPDFDTLKQLAENDPAQLAHLQETLTEELISNSKHQEQLRQLHHHLKQRVARCNNPYHRCITTMAMMHSKLNTMAHVMNNPDEFRAHKADILPLKHRG